MTLPAGFDVAPALDGPTLALRALCAADLPDLTDAAADPLIWAGHPAKERGNPDIFAPYARGLLEQGGVLVARQDGRIVGMSRFYAPPDQADSIAIGFTFLIRAVWGGATNAEFKALMLEHAFSAVDQVWFHIAPNNARSQAATAKLGARYRYDAELDHSGRPSQSKCYTISRADWRASSAAARARAAGVAVPQADS